jgi:hypothetical protein
MTDLYFFTFGISPRTYVGTIGGAVFISGLGFTKNFSLVNRSL